MEYDYNITVPVTVTADSKEAAEEAIINNLAEFVLENKEKIILKCVKVHTATSRKP